MNILQPLFAQTYEYSNGICKVDGIIQASTQPCEDAGKLFLGVAAAIFIPIFLIILLFLVFWINA